MSDVDCKRNILIIDDEPEVGKMLCQVLASDYPCQAVASAEEGLAALRSNEVALVITDINMDGITGLEMVPCIIEISPQTIVIIMSGMQTIESAIEAMRVGAFDYFMKPFDLRHVRLAVRRALEHYDLCIARQNYEHQLEGEVRSRTAALHATSEKLQEQIAERNRVEERLNHLAYYDALTELPNRLLFKDRLVQSLTIAQRDRQIVAVQLLSIDNLKTINDTLGPAMADKLIAQAAQRLGTIMRDGDTLGYWGSDEFAFLFTNLERPEDAIEIAQRIQSAFQLGFDLTGHEVYGTPSIGIVTFPLNGRDEESLMRNASAALFEAKKRGGNHYEFYTPELNSTAVDRLSLEGGLRRAIERNEFVVHYQPKVDVNNWQIVGAEALIRWQHPERGLLLPAEFIPFAEETGLISSIEEWCLRAVCRQIKQWKIVGSSLKSVSSNISPRQFQHPDFFARVARILDQVGVEPGHLELEVTESSIMTKPELAIQTLKELKKIGVSISMDDFGTGFSSLAYLKRLPIDILKIDRSFVSEVTTDRTDAALVKTIITLAHNLSLRVVAEGVESEDQLRLLLSLGCDEIQGYLFSKPLPAEAFKELLLHGQCASEWWLRRRTEDSISPTKERMSTAA